LVVQAEPHAVAALRLRDGVPAGFSPAREPGGAAGESSLAGSRPGADAQDRAEGLMKRALGIRDGLRAAGTEWEAPEHAWLCGERRLPGTAARADRNRFPAPQPCREPARPRPRGLSRRMAGRALRRRRGAGAAPRGGTLMLRLDFLRDIGRDLARDAKPVHAEK